MATRGFEFDSMLDGSNGTPRILDFTLGTSTSCKAGDVYQMQSDGYIDEQTASIDEVTCILQEANTSPSAEVTKVKAAVVTHNQVWRCSSDASTATTAIVGNTKTIDLADQNTIDADDITNGSLILFDKDEADASGNLIFKVVFADTTFGNA